MIVFDTYKYSHSCFDSTLNSITMYRYAATTPRLQTPTEL